MSGWADGETYLGRPVVDAGGRRLGRAVAVIHKARGMDVLVEKRSWLGHRVRRFRAEDMVLRDDGRLWVVGAGQRIPARVSPARGVLGMRDR